MGLALGVNAQGVMNGATFGGSADAPAVLVNYYQGASFSYTWASTIAKVTNTYTFNNQIGFAPGKASPDFGGLNAEQIAALNLGANPGAAKFQIALYLGAKGETDMAKFFRSLPTSGGTSNGAFSSAKPGYALSSTLGKQSAQGTINGAQVTFQDKDEVSAQVRAWVSSPGTPEYGTYEEFMQNVGFGAGGQAGYAGATPITQTKVGSATTPGTLGALQGVWFLYPVPEPSVVGLGLLGLAGLFFIRRRK